MHFALVDDQRTPPSPGLKGSCPACGNPMIAKCGNQRVHHWAHRGERACDSWWERETEWHRIWKNKFPNDRQEVIRLDPLGEKHIADVHTSHGLTIEFQHSHLGPDERAAREKFYGSMLWVVDGLRLKRDLPRFLDRTSSFRALKTGYYLTPFPDEVFPRSWISCSVPVIFDFENAVGLSHDSMHMARSLWCLLPGRVFQQAVVLRLSREAFVRWIHEKEHPIPTPAIMKSVELFLLTEHQQQVREANLRAAVIAAARQRGRWRPQGYRRRFRF